MAIATLHIHNTTFVQPPNLCTFWQKSVEHGEVTNKATYYKMYYCQVIQYRNITHPRYIHIIMLYQKVLTSAFISEDSYKELFLVYSGKMSFTTGSIEMFMIIKVKTVVCHSAGRVWHVWPCRCSFTHQVHTSGIHVDKDIELPCASNTNRSEKTYQLSNHVARFLVFATRFSFETPFNNSSHVWTAVLIWDLTQQCLNVIHWTN